jgi:hypothetical protein
MYGFAKEKETPSKLVYSHPYFQKDSKGNLEKIQKIILKETQELCPLSLKVKSTGQEGPGMSFGSDKNLHEKDKKSSEDCLLLEHLFTSVFHQIYHDINGLIKIRLKLWRTLST